jgi:hypothetical protein
MDDTMCSNGLLGYFAGARLGRSQDIGGAHGRVDQSLSLFRPDIVVADYAPTAKHVLQQRHRTVCWVGEAPCRSRDLHAARIAPYAA